MPDFPTIDGLTTTSRDTAPFIERLTDFLATEFSNDDDRMREIVQVLESQVKHIKDPELKMRADMARSMLLGKPPAPPS